MFITRRMAGGVILPPKYLLGKPSKLKMSQKVERKMAGGAKETQEQAGAELCQAQES